MPTPAGYLLCSAHCIHRMMRWLEWGQKSSQPHSSSKSSMRASGFKPVLTASTYPLLMSWEVSNWCSNDFGKAYVKKAANLYFWLASEK